MAKKKKITSKKGRKSINKTQQPVTFVYVHPAIILKQKLAKVWAKISAFIKDALP